MQYRTLGKTGLEVSALGYGAMRLPLKPGGGREDVDEEKAIGCIHRAFELGVNYIDSAHGYHGGVSEVVVGKAVKSWDGDIVVSTKNAYHDDSGSEWRRVLDLSLQRLGMDSVDLLLLHSVRWDSFSGPMSKKGGPMDEARKALDEGIIKHLSFSSHDSPDNIIKLIDTGIFATMTVQYNLLDRVNGKAIGHGHENGMGVIIMGPIGGGRLVSPSKFQHMVPGGAKSTPEIALRFVLANPAVSSALSGMNELEQVEENAAAATREEPLNAAEMRQVEQMLAESKRLSDLYCTGCGYCMPCPNGVNIPACFKFMNYHRVYGLTELAKRQYKTIRPDAKRAEVKGEKADKCEECGECEEKCPQDIPVIEQLKEVAKILGG